MTVSRPSSTFVVIGLMAGYASTGLSGAPQTVATARKSATVEDIYVVRSVRQSRVTPTTFCDAANTGFANAMAEDQYLFRSTATRASDGLIVDASVQTVGTIHACFGSLPDLSVVNFYGEGRLGGAAFKGIGECRLTPDYPERGLLLGRCFLDLKGLPDGYMGGRLTTNTITSNGGRGETTDPAGYIQSSIATVRLWKRRR
jgi:hypothetical protein